MPTVAVLPECVWKMEVPFVANLREAGFDVKYPDDPTFTRGLGTEEETVEFLRGCVASIAGGEWYTETVIKALPELRVIARFGVGYDRVDIPAATEHGRVVTITPTANHEAVAEHALALMFAVAKSIVSYDRVMRAGGWSHGKLLGSLRGETLGIAGFGRIGRSLAVRALALGMEVIASDPYADMEFARTHGIEVVEFDTLLARSDYISIHALFNDETRGLFNRRAFSKMKKGSVLVNTSRGGLVVEADLLEALQSGHLGAAGLDVFEEEPVRQTNPLFQLDNIVVSPHLAGLDQKGGMNMGAEAADCIIKLSRGEWPEGAVVNEGLKGQFEW